MNTRCFIIQCSIFIFPACAAPKIRNKNIALSKDRYSFISIIGFFIFYAVVIVQFKIKDEIGVLAFLNSFVLAILMAFVLLAGYFYSKARAVHMLGSIDHVVRYHYKPGRYFNLVLTPLAVLLFLSFFMLWFGYQKYADACRMIFESMWIAALNGIIQANSSFMLGKNGCMGPGCPFTKWNKIKFVKWDKDIGQTMYGFSLARADSPVHIRIYVHRSKKEMLEKLLAGYLTNAQLLHS